MASHSDISAATAADIAALPDADEMYVNYWRRRTNLVGNLKAAKAALDATEKELQELPRIFSTRKYRRRPYNKSRYQCKKLARQLKEGIALIQEDISVMDLYRI